MQINGFTPTSFSGGTTPIGATTGSVSRNQANSTATTPSSVLSNAYQALNLPNDPQVASDKLDALTKSFTPAQLAQYQKAVTKLDLTDHPTR